MAPAASPGAVPGQRPPFYTQTELQDMVLCEPGLLERGSRPGWLELNPAPAWQLLEELGAEERTRTAAVLGRGPSQRP